MTKPFTGWHLAAILVAFFGVVIAVNVTMARFATGTFGGTVVDNSYVASQQYNDWLKAAEAQAMLGWDERISLNAARQLTIAIDSNGKRMKAVTFTGVAHHPLGRAPSIALHFTTDASGMAIAREALPPGRWIIDLAASAGGTSARYRVEMP